MIGKKLIKSEMVFVGRKIVFRQIWKIFSGSSHVLLEVSNTIKRLNREELDTLMNEYQESLTHS